MRIIDTHSHVYFPQFDEDRDAVYARMREAQVQTITVGTGFETSKQAIRAAIDTPEVVIGATIGVHPTHASEGFDDRVYGELLEAHRDIVVGVGECGLDYYRDSDQKAQRAQSEVFDMQMAFAIQYGLPLMLHVRSAAHTVTAHQDALAMITRAQRIHGAKVCGTCHFFTGPLEIAKEFWDRGFATSFPGVVTFAKECEEVVRAAPRDLMLAETDAPYAAPIPHRGQRNEPTWTTDVVQHIAALRGEEVEEAATYLLENSQRIFHIV